jgi:hypothetical protein
MPEVSFVRPTVRQNEVVGQESDTGEFEYAPGFG